MKKVIAILFLSLLFTIGALATSPHGKNFGLNCEICHTPDKWTIIKNQGFNHDTTAFPLTGQHKTVSCRQCHPDLVFENAKKLTSCSSCHQDIHQQTLGTDCARCHTTKSWIVENVSMIHVQIGFPLRGRHAVVDCHECHETASTHRYDLITTNCYNCHSSEYAATTNPSHVQGNFPKDCSFCHNENSWTQAIFNHNTTGFPLTGSHSGLDCKACHPNNFNPIPTTCVSCHQKDFNNTTNPNHVTAKFPTTCETCHNTTAWVPATFDHTANTSFPLTGSHIGLACNACHINNFDPIPSTCVSCHQKEYNSALNPNHSAAKFSTSCETCHNTTAWQPSTFNHNTSTTFPLTGAHITVACTACHINNVYAGLSTTCVSCHQTDYNNATNPNHSANSTVFTTNCSSCHNTSAWQPAPNFNHTSYFPISSGRHSGISCSTCHTNSSNYTVFTCITSSCHQTAHNQNQGSAGCYRCHPTGRAG